MKNRKRGLKRGVEVDTSKTIVAVFIVVLVVVIVVLGYASQAKGDGIISKLLKLFPDFFQTNYTAKPIVQCPLGYSEIGYINSVDQFISLNGKKTFLYQSNNEIKIKVPWQISGNIGIIGSDPTVGYIDNGAVDSDLLYDISKREFEFKKYFPEEKERIRLARAKIFEGTLCITNNDYNRIEQSEKCILTCQVMDGICSATQVNGKFLYKQLDCPNGQICYIDETYEKLDSKDISIITEASRSEYYRFIDKDRNSKNTVSNIVSSNVLDAVVLERVALKLFTSSKIPFCYSYDSDKEDKDLTKGYQIIDTNLKDPSVNSAYSNEFSYSGDKIFQFVAWNDAYNQKVIKRWKFSSPTDYITNHYFIINTENPGWFTSSKVGEINYGVVKSTRTLPQGSYLSLLEPTFYDESSRIFYLIKDGKRTDTTRFIIKKDGGKDKIYTYKETTPGFHTMIYTNLYLTLFNDEEGTIISNNEFKYKLASSKVGDRYYVIGLNKQWEYGAFSKDIKSTSDYKIEIETSTLFRVPVVCIYTRDLSAGNWHQLKCNNVKYNSFNLYLTYCMNINEISSSLLDTLDKSCYWGS